MIVINEILYFISIVFFLGKQEHFKMKVSMKKPLKEMFCPKKFLIDLLNKFLIIRYHLMG